MAEKLMGEAAERDPAFADAIEAHGEILDAVGDAAGAAEKYAAARSVRRQILRGAPDRHFVVRQGRGDSMAAIRSYSVVIKSLRRHSLPYLARGNAYLVSGELRLALDDYERALRLHPRSMDILAMKAEALLISGRYAEAAAIFNRILATGRLDSDLLSGHAIAELASGRLDQANAAWRRQFTLNQSRPIAQAFIAMRLADYEAALQAFDRIDHRMNGDEQYWALYRDIAAFCCGAALPSLGGALGGSWPELLQALLRSEVDAALASRRADTPHRRAELHFLLGVLAGKQDRETARGHWARAVAEEIPSLVEHAAAHNELAR